MSWTPSRSAAVKVVLSLIISQTIRTALTLAAVLGLVALAAALQNH